MRLQVKIILCVFLVLFAAASFLAVLADLGVFAPAAEEGAAAGGYALRVWNGYIGVFSPPDADEPRTVTDVYVRTLPPADRMALIRGVTAADREAAVRLLEDYGA